MLRTGVTVIALSLGAATVASAQPAIDTLLSSLARQGFGAFEVKRENGQVKVEGYRGTIERELTYDAATGRLIKDEVNRNDVRDDDRRDDRAARGRDRDDDRADARTDARNHDPNDDRADDRNDDRDDHGGRGRGGDDGRNDDRDDRGGSGRGGSGRGGDDNGPDDHDD